ncbi:MAG: sensor histidine kinase [Candidatus Hodarchaeales archaeon]
MKFRGENPAKIHVSCEKVSHEHVFSIRDEGIGIGAKHHGKIFDLFSRLHTRDEYPGTGIGLTLCKRIVEHLGGTIRVESEPGKGSVFSFTIPFHPS